MAHSTLHLYDILSSVDKTGLVGSFMKNNVARVCGNCSNVYYPKRLDRAKKFCSSSCSLKVNRYAPKRFWESASFEEKCVRWKAILAKHTVIKDGCWGWSASLSGGYGSVCTGSRTNAKAHRVSWMVNFGPIPSEKIVLHNCDNRACTNPSHLRIGTHKDNADDKYRRNRDKHVSCEKHCRSTLNNEQVLEIRSLLANGGSVRSLADRFNVGWHAINHIRIGKTWRNLK